LIAEVVVLGTKLATQTFDASIDRILAAAHSGRVFRVHFANVHTIVEAEVPGPVRDAFKSADMVCMDGMPLVWLARRRGAPNAERVSGPDAMLAICDRGRPLGLRHYFYGGRSTVADQVAKALETRFPGIEIVGTRTPPELDVGRLSDPDGVMAINATHPHVVWVALGAPKQELWAAANAARLTAGVVMPVGAAFDFHAGRLRRAPGWMRDRGLEWLFRLASEPRRLGWRYLSTNARFLWLLLQERRRSRRSA
jgi:N-acetylglucosaminyldiphosphoundecaprenol N-acetyl-beta-D-mannosaminyltransferase